MKIDTGDVDLTTVETGIPILRPGDYEVTIETMEVVSNKAGDGEILVFKAPLQNNEESRDGEVVHAGFPIFGRASLKETEKYNPVKRHLVPLMDCFLGFRPAAFETEDFIGKTGTVRLVISQDPQYGDRNEIKAYLPKESNAISNTVVRPKLDDEIPF
jgi:hypothetical protein